MSADVSRLDDLTIWAVIAAGKHLFPFRTEKLSPLAPMVLGEQSPGRVGRRPFLRRRAPETGPFVVRARSSRGAELVAPVRIELAQPSNALAERRVRDEQRGEALLGERVRRCRAARSPGEAWNATSSIVLLEPEQRVGEAVRRVAELRGEAVGLRTRASARAADARTTPRAGRARRAARARASRRCAMPRRRAGEDRRRASGRARRGCGGARARARARPRAPPAARRRAAPSRPRARRRRAAPRPAESARGISVRDHVELRRQRRRPRPRGARPSTCRSGASASA